LRNLGPDIIEVADPYHLGWFARSAAGDLGIPLVAFAHSDLVNVFATRFGRGVGAITKRYLRSFYSMFDLVVAPSRVIAERLAALGVKEPVVQPLGVDGGLFNPGRYDPGLRAELRLADSTRLLVFAGRMGSEKQIPRLLQIFSDLGSRYHLLLVGGARRQQLTANVTLLPYERDATRLARLLASSDALVHAGTSETFGLVVLEAMACGRPVIGVNAGAVAELIDDEVGVLADNDDARSLKHAIEKLYSGDLAKMGRRARARVEHEYTWDRTCASLLERYQQLSRLSLPTLHSPIDVRSTP
jgi:alpha-1,6-mannosyltransferase